MTTNSNNDIVSGDKKERKGVCRDIDTMRKRLRPPTFRGCRYDADKFEKAKQKHEIYIERLVAIFCLAVRTFNRAMIMCKRNSTYLHPIYLTSFHAIMSGGIRIRIDSEGNEYRAPIHSHFTIEVNSILNVFFTKEHRGSSEKGCSKWKPKQIVILNDSSVRLLSLIAEEMEEKFLAMFKFISKRTEGVINLNFGITRSGNSSKLLELLSIVFSHLDE